MAHSEKETYESYPTDAFDNPPSGPVGVHRGRRSVAVRIAPFIVVIVVAALAGLLTWGIASGELGKVQWPWAQQSAQKASPATEDENAKDDGDDADAQTDDDVASQGDDAASDDGAASQGDDAATQQDQQPEPQPEQTVNYNTAVRVVNAAGINGYAAQQSGVLQSVGYTNVTAANPSGGTLPSSNVVWYQNETDLATAQNVANTLGIANVEQATGIADPIVVVYVYAQ